MKPEDYKTILDMADAEERSRAEQMPTETDALRQINHGYMRLKELGFKEIIYCPKDVNHTGFVGG